jgi:DNA-binding MarR family transcriptional regulator
MYNDIYCSGGYVYDIEQSIGFLLAKAYQKGFGMFRERLLAYNITPPQFSLLAFLWKQDGLTQAELSEKSQIDRTTMVGLVDRLEKEGLVKRDLCPGDRRAYNICLTERGRSLEDELCAIAVDVTSAFTKNVSAAEAAALKKILNKIRR